MIKPMDLQERETIFHDLNTNFLVEAGAGSGKTTSLVGRLISLVKAGVPVNRIAAITFTNKAADEMVERFRIGLEKAWQQAEKNEKAHIERALQTVSLGFIGTIHSFCARVLRERPIEAGLDPEFTEMDEQTDWNFREQCWEEYIHRLHGTKESEALQELIQLQVDVNTLKSLYHRVSEFADVELPAEQVERPDFTIIRDSLFPLAEEASRYIPSEMPEKGWDVLQTRLRMLQQKMKYVREWDEMRLLELAQTFNVQLQVTQNRWTDKQQAKRFKERFHEWQMTVLDPLLQQWREYLYPKIIAFVRPALAYNRQQRMERGMLNFQDLLMETAKLLRERPEVRQSLAARYERLLVDEFQDTDPIQAEIVFLLAGKQAQATERDWKRIVPRPGALFVVGDPKQSIYRFRRADISIYNEVKRKILEHGGQVIKLTTNFRSVGSLGQYINGQFVGKFPPKATEAQAEFVPMNTVVPEKKHGKKLKTGVYVCMYPKLEGGKMDIAKVDANRIAKTIAWACTNGNLKIQERNERNEYVLRNAVPSDFLIITKTKDVLHLYAESLDAYGIPTETDGSISSDEELKQLVQLAMSLADATDKLALLNVLRGPFFGIMPGNLLAYGIEGHRLNYNLIPDISSCSENALPVREALVKLRRYARWVDELPALAALERIIQDIGLFPFAAMSVSGSTRVGTLTKVLHMLQQEAPYDWNALTKILAKACSEQGTETSSLHAGSGNAVRIMNLHKAKGLEAPVVYLACPVGEFDHDADQVIDRSKAVAEGYFTMSRSKGRWGHKELIATPPGWEEMKEKEREFMHAEKDRLLYVAATRAKQLLVISHYPAQPAKSPWASLLEGMELTPEFDEPDFARDVPDVYSARISVEDFIKQRDRSIAEVQHPTYVHVSVTELTKDRKEGKMPNWSSQGKGVVFGTVVHNVLEEIGKMLADSDVCGEMIEWLVRMHAEREELPAEHIEAAIETVQNVLQSEIWQRRNQATHKFHELKLIVRKSAQQFLSFPGINQAEVAASAEMTPLSTVIIHGVIDLLFEEEDGWVLVDFKTDLVEEDRLDEYVQFYTPQIQTYANEWTNTFGHRVKETGLYFTYLGRYVVVE